MVFHMNNLLSHIKTTVYSSIGLGYQSACDYPVVLGAGILLLFLHKLCPSLFTFLLSSSPVFLLTALLLGALLSYGEPCAPLNGEEILESQQTSSQQSKIPATDRSHEQVENVEVEAYEEKIFESRVAYEERICDVILHDTHYDEKDATVVSTDTVLCAEEPSAKSNVVVEREEQTGEICEKVELQEFEITDTERCHNEVRNKYQLGELMSSCWQPVMRQDPCSDTESDLSGSSSDASMTDIIPMLDELNPPVNLGTGHPSSITFRDNLNSLPDDEDDSEEDGDHSSNEDGVKEKKDDGNNLKDVSSVDSSDVENDSYMESSMERRRAKNILKFELDKRLMDMQANDAIQKMEEVSRFRVQVPSISTPRPKPFDPSNDSEETVELPQIPDSAPSVLLPGRKPFDIPFNQIVEHDRKLQETWTPRSYFPSTQHRKHGNLHIRQSTFLQQHNGIKLEKYELSGKDASDNISDSDSEQIGNNGKLFGSLDAHIGEEIKILSAAISDGCVLEMNHGINRGIKDTDSSNDTNSFYIQKDVSNISEAKDLVPPGSEQGALGPLSRENNLEQYNVEADSISELNSLFKCRMEEVLVQSISEPSIGEPLTIKLEDELIGTLSADSGMPVTEANSVEELNPEIAQVNEETLACVASHSTCDNEWIQDKSSEAIPAENGHISELPIEDRTIELSAAGDQQSRHSSELQVIEARSIEDIDLFITKYCEEAQKNDDSEPFMQCIAEYTTEHLPSESDEQPGYISDLHVDEQPGHISDLHVLEASSVEDITAAFKKVHDEVEIHSASVVGESALVKTIVRESEVEAISDSTLDEPRAMNVENKPTKLLTEDCELPVVEASSIEEMKSLFKQLEEEAQAQMYSSSENKFGQDEGETSSDMLVVDAKTIEDISSAFGQLSSDHGKAHIPGDGDVILDLAEPNSGFHAMEANTMDGDDESDRTKIIEPKESLEKA